MYRINKLSRPTLITVDEVIAKAVVDENADIQYLVNSIEVAEERFIAPELGNAFYENFIAVKNVVVTSGNQATLLVQINASLTAAGKNSISSGDLVLGMMVNAIEFCPVNYQTLWNRFLWKIVAEAVDILAIVPSWTRSTAQGQQQNNPKVIGGTGEGSATADRKDVEYKVDTMVKSRLYPLIARMKQWIQETGGYPLFPCTTQSDGISKSSRVILGLYEDYNPNGANMWGNSPRDRNFEEEICAPASATPAPTPIPVVQTMWRSIKLLVKTTPNPLALIAVGGGKTIQAEYAPGATLTPMKIGDAEGYLAGRPFFNNIILNGMEYPEDQYNSTDGIFTGGFNNNDYLKVTFLDNV